MTYPEAVTEFKRAYWTKLLARCGHNVKAAAQEAGVNRTHAYKVLHSLGVPHPWGRTGHRGNWGKCMNHGSPPHRL